MTVGIWTERKRLIKYRISDVAIQRSSTSTVSQLLWFSAGLKENLPHLTMCYNKVGVPNSSPCLVSVFLSRTAATGRVACSCFINSSLLSISWQVSDSIMIWRINFRLREAHWGCCDAGSIYSSSSPTLPLQPCHQHNKHLMDPGSREAWISPPGGSGVGLCCFLLFGEKKKKPKPGRGVIVSFILPSPSSHL